MLHANSGVTSTQHPGGILHSVLLMALPSLPEPRCSCDCSAAMSNARLTTAPSRAQAASSSGPSASRAAPRASSSAALATPPPFLQRECRSAGKPCTNMQSTAMQHACCLPWTVQ